MPASRDRRPFETVGPLYTDLYNLTMAQAAYRLGRHTLKTSSTLFVRENPFKGGYLIAAGLADAIDWLRNFKFRPPHLVFLRTQVDKEGNPLFDEEFLAFLLGSKLEIDLFAVPEGTVVFPNQPLVRVEGPEWQCRLVESALLNILLHETLIATAASRYVWVANGDPVFEGGMRRAAGLGSLTAARAAYIGGFAGTSNVLAGYLYGLPILGTFAHSWVMQFDDEDDAFEAYAEGMPGNGIFLVDTYNTLSGVKKAIVVGRKLKARGHKLFGIRLDSGDLAYLSKRARRLLDEAGFTDTLIVASNDITPQVMLSLKHEQKAKINVWLIGTFIINGLEKVAEGDTLYGGRLSGAYKLGGIWRDNGSVRPVMKLSDSKAKTTNPGRLDVVRYLDKDGQMVGDMILDAATDIRGGAEMIDPLDDTRRKTFGPKANAERLQVPVFRKGKLVYKAPTLNDIRARASAQLAALDESHRRLTNPHVYPVGLEKSLYRLKNELITAFKARKD